MESKTQKIIPVASHTDHVYLDVSKKYINSPFIEMFMCVCLDLTSNLRSGQPISIRAAEANKNMT